MQDHVADRALEVEPPRPGADRKPLFGVLPHHARRAVEPARDRRRVDRIVHRLVRVTHDTAALCHARQALDRSVDCLILRAARNPARSRLSVRGSVFDR